MNVPSRELSQEYLELIEFAREIVNANTDGEDGSTRRAPPYAEPTAPCTAASTSTLHRRAVRRARALGYAARPGARELSVIVAVGNCRRGPEGPCGRDRQILFDYHPRISVILPTPEGIRNVRITDLMPLGAVSSATEGTQPFDRRSSMSPPARPR